MCYKDGNAEESLVLEIMINMCASYRHKIPAMFRQRALGGYGTQQLPTVLCLHLQLLVKRWHGRCNPSLKSLPVFCYPKTPNAFSCKSLLATEFFTRSLQFLFTLPRVFTRKQSSEKLIAFCLMKLLNIDSLACSSHGFEKRNDAGGQTLTQSNPPVNNHTSERGQFWNYPF
uniref:Uncharacterized protein n=1 Tax=Cucumis melo TaxID=3656 RepID=A0A9I9EA82_CUCME